MQRFYMPALEEWDESLTIKNPEILNQMIKVLRVKKGDEFAFFNGDLHKDFIFQIVSVDKREVYLEKVWYEEKENEISFSLNIINALPNKVEKMEYIIQKATEIWVTGFYFFQSQRSQKLRLSENKIERLHKIIIEAAEQSGRSCIPELIIEDGLHLEFLQENENLFFHTQSEDSILLKDITLDREKWINIIVGPEWGFSEEEVELFEQQKFHKTYLWKRILRTETVGVVTSFYCIQR